MNIVVCNDSRGSTPDDLGLRLASGRIVPEPERSKWREQLNWDGALVEILRDRGHTVSVFDAYLDDLISQQPTPAAAAADLCTLVSRNSVDAVLFDLQYFGKFEFGEEMLSWMDSNCPKWKSLKIIVASRYLEHNGAVSQEQLLSNYPYIHGFLNRFTTPVREIIDSLC